MSAQDAERVAHSPDLDREGECPCAACSPPAPMADQPVRDAEFVREHEHVPTRPVDSVMRCWVAGCDWTKHVPWPGFCQVCGASLFPADASSCRLCGASDYDGLLGREPAVSGPKGEIPGSPSRQIASRPPLPPSRHRLRPAELARLFHDTYERLAPAFGYSTRPESKVAWNDVPENSRLLMIATAAEVLQLIDGST